jgi:hypothetical protein
MARTKRAWKFGEQQGEPQACQTIWIEKVWRQRARHGRWQPL